MSNPSTLEEYLEKFFNASERMSAFTTRKFHTLEMEIIETCNMQCVYCYPESSPKSKRRVSLSTAEGAISDAVDSGVQELVVLGGEPMLHPQWDDILAYAHAEGMRTTLCTNGTPIDRNVASIMETVDWLRLHLDSASASEFALLQRPRNVREHSRILNGVNKLLEAGYSGKNIELVVPLTRQSYKTLQTTLDLARNEWGVELTTLIPIVDYGAALSMDKKELLTSAEYRAAFQLRADAEQKPYLMQLGTSEYPKEYQTTTFMITVSGDIIPYPALPIVCGNIYRDSLSAVLKSKYDTLAFRDILTADGNGNIIMEECGSCNNSDHCFGTRSMAYNNGQGYGHSDPTCWLVDQPAHRV